MDKEVKRSAVGRVIWRDLTTPDSSKKFTVKLAMESEVNETEELRDMVEESIKERWGNKVPKNINNPIKNGDDQTDSEGNTWPATAGMTVATFKTKFEDIQGKIYSKDGRTKVNPEDIYAGCYARVLYSTFALANGGPQKNFNGVIFNLEAVQFCDDGEKLGGPSTGFDKDNPFGVEDSEDGSHPFDD